MVAVRSASATTGAYVTSVIVTKPSGTAAGDLLLAVLTQDEQVDTSTERDSMTFPAGFSAPTTYAPTGVNPIKVAWKAAGGSEPGDYTFGVDSAATSAASLIAITDADLTTPINAGPTGATGGDEVYDTSHVAAAVTPTVADALLVVADATTGNDVTFSPPGSMTERVEVAADPSYGVSHTLCTQVLSGGAGASTGTRTITATDFVQWATVTLAVAPAPTVTPLPRRRRGPNYRR